MLLSSVVMYVGGAAQEMSRTKVVLNVFDQDDLIHKHNDNILS